jgi:diaminohydroxyphosphoribosylaminopyrimidine deaminase / 5-amino-6-(5-phosphoribosylamino)uracil reductase
MRRAIELAKRAWGDTHPNPLVGAVIVEQGQVVAEGWHARAGEAHAEVAALTALGRAPAEDATLYVTLEPCSTEGRTGSCIEAIVRSGLRRVVVGSIDPNPQHQGRGLEALKAAGVTVESRVLEAECEDLNLIFNHWISRRAPLFAAKSATTLDGRIATRSGESKWITGESARADVMMWRKLFPAIAVGAGTAMSDQPRLTARVPGDSERCPTRFVFDGLFRTGMERHLPSLYTDEFRTSTVIVTTTMAATGYIRRVEKEGPRVWVLPSSSAKVSFPEFRRRCAEEGICGVYFEGGSQLVSELIHARELDYLFCYRAPMIFADDKAKPVYRGLRTDKLDKAIRLERTRHAVFGDDQLMRGFVTYPGRLDVDETAFSDR